MSFMFKPLAYDDMQAVNHIELPEEVKQDVTEDSREIAERLSLAMEAASRGKKSILSLDGYVSAPFTDLVFKVKEELENRGHQVKLIDMKKLYKSQEEIDRLTGENLPLNYEDDPVLLFGKLYRGVMDDLIDCERACQVLEAVKGEYVILYGLGSLCMSLRPFAMVKGYVDVTPKIAAIRAREKKYVNIGDREARPFNLLMRRNYYVDFEVTVKLRRDLVLNNILDFYLLGNWENHYMMMSGRTMDTIMSSLVCYPFRAKPVYLEGIWGGEFIRKVRNIPKDIAGNVAWIFDFIPMEVSIVVDVAGKLADFPFSTFLQKKGLEIMGQQCLEEFEGYFPVRFNYDDTWHSDGNMSVQVHPDEDFVIENYDEFGRQDEAYYVVAVGHGAKTYCGFRGDGREFLKLAKQSEISHQSVDYQRYINWVDSVPGRQIMIPAGTVHASGRNQLILELGSLTIGSYTYKVYDYNRKDSEGKTRPIHTRNAEKVLHFERDSQWVKENIAIEPFLLSEGEGYKEYVVGQTELMYYEAHRIEIDTHAVYEGRNNGQFTVVTVVDGEQVKIYSKSNPDFSYMANFLDIITIPAGIEDYVIEAKGYQPVVMHKVVLREGYTRYKNPVYKNSRKRD